MIARSFRCPPARPIASHRYVLPTSPPTSAGPRAAVPRIPDTGHPGRGGMRPLQGRLWWRGRRGRFVGERLREGPHVAAVPAVRCRGRPTFAGQAYGVLREAQETHEGAIKVQICAVLGGNGRVSVPLKQHVHRLGRVYRWLFSRKHVESALYSVDLVRSWFVSGVGLSEKVQTRQLAPTIYFFACGEIVKRQSDSIVVEDPDPFCGGFRKAVYCTLF